jgi:DNA-binding transcriptional MerR regulator
VSAHAINFPAPAATPAELAAHAAPGTQRDLCPAPQAYPGAFKPLSREDVAGILGISIRTLENWVKQGRLPAPASIAGRRYWHPERFYAALDVMLQQGNEQGSHSSLISAAAHASPAVAKSPKVPSSTAGQRARQSSQDTSLAMLREAASRATTLADAQALA